MTSVVTYIHLWSPVLNFLSIHVIPKFFDALRGQTRPKITFNLQKRSPQFIWWPSNQWFIPKFVIIRQPLICKCDRLLGVHAQTSKFWCTNKDEIYATTSDFPAPICEQIFLWLVKICRYAVRLRVRVLILRPESKHCLHWAKIYVISMVPPLPFFCCGGRGL